jgi:hypothetical protein
MNILVETDEGVACICGDVIYDIVNQLINPHLQVMELDPAVTGNHAGSKRGEKGAIRKAVNSGRFVLPVHDRPAVVEAGRVGELGGQLPLGAGRAGAGHGPAGGHGAQGHPGPLGQVGRPQGEHVPGPEPAGGQPGRHPPDPLGQQPVGAQRALALAGSEPQVMALRPCHPDCENSVREDFR